MPSQTTSIVVILFYVGITALEKEKTTFYLNFPPIMAYVIVFPITEHSRSHGLRYGEYFELDWP